MNVETGAANRTNGPTRTLRIGDRITVHGDLEIVAIDGARVQVRVQPTATPIMFPVKPQLKDPSS